MSIYQRISVFAVCFGFLMCCTGYSAIVSIDGKITVGGSLPIPPDYPAKTAEYVPSAPVRASFDWRNHSGHNWITDAKDQGGCGSCWAFADAGAFEAQYRISNNNPTLTLDLSERFESACYRSIPPYLNPSCSLGWYAEVALDHMAAKSNPYVQGDTGICSEVCYPYGTMESGFNPSGCGLADSPPACSTYLTERLYLTDWQELWPANSPPANPDEVIKSFINTHGPVIVRMALLNTDDDTPPHTTNDDWYDFTVDFWYDFDPYTVWSGPDGSCDSDPDCGGHSVLIVGYDDAAATPYWIVKNSWGDFQKDSGFFRMAMGYNNSGIYYHPMIVFAPSAPSTPATGTWGIIGMIAAFTVLLSGVLIFRR